MKNILSILADAGVEVTDEQKKSIEDGVKENYKPVADWQKQVDKVQNLEDQLKSTKESLAKFDGVDADALNKQISDLKADLEQKDKDYQNQIADRDFQDMLKESIASAKGKNAKAITALLDLETLKASKNQKEDIAAALKALTEAEAFTFTTLAALENISKTNGTIENATRLLDTLLAEYVYGKDNAVNEVAKLKVQLRIE